MPDVLCGILLIVQTLTIDGQQIHTREFDFDRVRG